MDAITDATKAYRLLWRAFATRTAHQRVRQTLSERDPRPARSFRVAV